ncbi:MAG: hypothetical protein IKY44_00600 [Clostridia bacterium]|nr:hypothetical protein [Clostridia bacterium]
MLKGKRIALCIIALLIVLGAFAGCDRSEIIPTTPLNPNPPDGPLIYPLGFWQASYDDTPYIDSIMCDLDNDGQDEEVRLYHGPTSGVTSYIIAVWKNETLHYSKMSVLQYGGFWSFKGSTDGAVEIEQENGYNPETGETKTTTLLLHFNQYGLLVLNDKSTNEPYDYTSDAHTTYAFIDIDGDGQNEDCVIERVDDTPDSPFRILAISCINEVKLKYYGVYDYGSLSHIGFARTSTGEYVLYGLSKDNPQSSAIAAVWDIRIEDGKLALYDNERLIEQRTDYPGTADPLSYVYVFNNHGSVRADLNGDGDDEELTIGHYRVGMAMSSTKHNCKWALRVTDKNGTRYTELGGLYNMLTLHKDELGRIIVKKYTERKTDGGTVASLVQIGELKYVKGEYCIASLYPVA